MESGIDLLELSVKIMNTLSSNLNWTNDKKARVRVVPCEEHPGVQTDREIDRQQDRHKDRHTHTQSDRETDSDAYNVRENTDGGSGKLVALIVVLSQSKTQDTLRHITQAHVA